MNGREGGKTGECAKVRTEVASLLGNFRGGGQGQVHENPFSDPEFDEDD